MMQKLNKINTKIVLTKNEEQIFNLFTNYCKESNSDSILRVAGGWVRDKVLGKESHDIDIAIDNMTGENFLNNALNYLKSNSDLSGFGVTKINQEKSKHLETARVKINGQWIDIVNLRGETYNQDSRIPQIEIGTPKDDAFRRDLTINSLFYNLMNKQIEDFTQLGLDDLQNGIIRTPLDPKVTFTDDPLRILRTLRFQSRFEFQLCQEIQDCLQDPNIIQNLKSKVTKERISIELISVLQHETAFQGIQSYYKYKLFDIIFDIPPIAVSDFDKKQIYENSFQNCLNFNKYKNNWKYSILILEQIQYYCYLAIILLPFNDIKIKKNNISVYLGPYIIKEQLKLSNKDFQIIQENANLHQEIKNLIKNQNIENAIKFLNKAKSNWEFHLMTYIINLLSQDITFENYNQIRDYIFQNNLETFFQIPLPISVILLQIKGNDIQKIYNKKGGAFIQNALNKIQIFYAKNRDLTKEDLINEISENKDYYQE